MFQSRITVGSNIDPRYNSLCFDGVIDTGWYECYNELEGNIVSFFRTSSIDKKIRIWTLRAYSSANVLQFAQVVSQPTPEQFFSAENLLRMNPSTLSPVRFPYSDLFDQSIFDSSLYSCVDYRNLAGKPMVVTFKLDQPYIVDAVLLIGNENPLTHISNLNFYIGHSQDY